MTLVRNYYVFNQERVVLLQLPAYNKLLAAGSWLLADCKKSKCLLTIQE